MNLTTPAITTEEPGGSIRPRTSFTCLLRDGWPMLVCAAAIFLLSHPFGGMIGDSKIYMGRALADTNPGGVGRDMMFVLDGQSQFSLFATLARATTAFLSPAASAQIIVAISQTLLIAALVVLGRSLAGRSFAWVVIFAAILPPSYGPVGLLHFAEPLAEPRPLAEAFVLFGMGAWLGNRRIGSIGLLVVAAAIHPLMASAGFATIGIILMMERAAWRYAAVAGLLSFAAAAALGLPFAGRLLETADTQWLDLLRTRSPLLFPHLWITDAAPLMAVQALTLLAAAGRATGQTRILFLAVLVAGVAGVASALIVGLWWPSVLYLQLQVWRMWWLVAALSAVAFGFLVVKLGRGSPRDQVVLAVLTLSWAETGLGIAAPVIATAAVLLQRGAIFRSLVFTPRHALQAWICVAAVVASIWITDLPQAREALFGWPDGYRPRLVHLLFQVVQQPLIVACAALFVANCSPQMTYGLRACIGIALAGAATILWNDATSFDRAVARGEFQEILAKAALADDGDILWLAASNESWLWLRQPNWAARIQGAGIVFSRQLSARYDERARTLLDLGIDDLFTSQISSRVPFPPRPSAAALAQLCARPDAPVSIIAPIDATMSPPAEWKARTVWRAPAARVETPDGNIEHSITIRDYAVIRCADHR